MSISQSIEVCKSSIIITLSVIVAHFAGQDEDFGGLKYILAAESEAFVTVNS